MTGKLNIAVLGAGSWGTTLAILLHDNGHRVTLWEFDREQAAALERDRDGKPRLLLVGSDVTCQSVR